MYFLDLRWISLARDVVRISVGRLEVRSFVASCLGDVLALSVWDAY